MQKARVLLVLGVAIWASVQSMAVVAHAPDTVLQVSQVDNRQIEIEPKPVEWEQKCKQVDTNLDEKIASFTKRRDAHLEKYQLVVEMFESIQATLSEAGFDASSLDELLPELNSRIVVFRDTATKMIDELQHASNGSCGDYSVFSVDLANSRAGLKGTRLAASDIRKYVIEVLIPEVRNIINEAR